MSSQVIQRMLGRGWAAAAFAAPAPRAAAKSRRVIILHSIKARFGGTPTDAGRPSYLTPELVPLARRRCVESLGLRQPLAIHRRPRIRHEKQLSPLRAIAVRHVFERFTHVRRPVPGAVRVTGYE